MSYDHPRYDRDYRRSYSRGTPSAGCLAAVFRHPRILTALALVAIGLFTYYGRTEKRDNPFTGEDVRVILTPEQEEALGLQSVPEMISRFGGRLGDPVQQDRINRIGAKLLAAKEEILKRRGKDDYDYRFQFHILRDPETINAFALPGGQIFITSALLRELDAVGRSRGARDDAVAGVVGHEIGHVLAWHSNKQMANNSLLQSIASAAAVATSSDTGSGHAVGQLVGQLLQTKFGREDESQSDRIGVQLLIVAGYDPAALIDVMEVLKKSMRGPRPPEILSTHPFPETRKQEIEEYIEYFKRDPFGVWKG
jgi:predicted Zn-dependent protease